MSLPSSPSSPRSHVFLVYRDELTGERVAACGASGLQSSLEHTWGVVVVESTTPTSREDGGEWGVARDGVRVEMALGNVTFRLWQITAHITFDVALSVKSLIEGWVGGYTTVIVVVVVLSLGPSPSPISIHIFRYGEVTSARLRELEAFYVMLCWVVWKLGRTAPFIGGHITLIVVMVVLSPSPSPSPISMPIFRYGVVPSARLRELEAFYVMLC